MCLYPKFIKNPRYQPNKKNGGNPPICTDERMYYVPTGCGNCIECRKQKARNWQVRLAEELKCNKFAYFTTLTFSEESLAELVNKHGREEYNAIAAKAIRLFLERWRKKYKKSLKHWFITELGHTGTERIHLHGIIFSDFEITNELLQSFWQYGYSDTGEYCNIKTINYIVKYVTKIDLDHKDYKAEIFASPGIGGNYTKNDFYKSQFVYRRGQSREYYILSTGQKVNLPIYYRNKFYNESERELLWRDRLDKHTIWVNGIECNNIDTDEGIKTYYSLLEEQQRFNESIGFGNRNEEWKKKPYNITLRRINARTHEKDARAREQHDLADIANATTAQADFRSYEIKHKYNLSNAELDKITKDFQ